MSSRMYTDICLKLRLSSMMPLQCVQHSNTHARTHALYFSLSKRHSPITHFDRHHTSRLNSVQISHRQVTAVLHKHRSLPLNGVWLCSPLPPQQRHSRWDSFRDKWLQRAHRTGWGTLGHLPTHLPHTWLSDQTHTQPQQHGHTQLWISIPV